MEDLQAAIARATELLKTARHAAMATVNHDGTPHNTPFYLILDKDIKNVYFGSHPDSLHVQNVLRTGNLFVVVYDAVERGGLFMRAEAGHVLLGKELATGLAAHNSARARDGREPIDLGYYQHGTQRMYGATITQLWVNAFERNAQGLILRDYRHEIHGQDLLGSKA